MLCVPSYYTKFKCIADKCKNSCCVGWDVGVDRDTLARHASSSHPLSRELTAAAREVDGEYYITASHGACPFLDSRGLCRIISAMGEELVSDICRRHPRFYHTTPRGCECGIGASCEEAARLILSEGDFSSFVLIDGEAVDVKRTHLDTVEQRERAYGILLSDSTHEGKLKEIAELFSLDYSRLESAQISGAIDELELCDESHTAILSSRGDCPEWAQTYSERFLAYLLFRHLTPSADVAELSLNAAFCILLCRMYDGALSACDGFDDALSVARIISEEIEYSEDNTDALKMEIYVSLI